MELEKTPAERTFYRTIERLGDKFEFVLERHQQLLVRNNLVSKEQFVDFSSIYFEGTKPGLGALGYSRDSAPRKKQITFEISTYRWENRADTYIAMLHFACGIITWRATGLMG